MIIIKRSPTADTRSCDWSQVSKDVLLSSSKQHKEDVSKALNMFIEMLKRAADTHDADKISLIDEFHNDFITGFKNHAWWDNHVLINRHHIDKPEGRADDINLIDVIEHISDCVMAGMARSGNVYDIDLPPDLLKKAVFNTVNLLKSSVVVEDSN